MLKISMLQTPSVQLDGKPISFPFKRADALLYYMAVRRSATRQELIALLWESCDEATGLKNLRNTLYTLKKCLGGEFLLSPQKSIVVVNDNWELDCDYDHFTQEGDFSAYRGPFLQGFFVKQAFSYEEWLERTRERLHEQYLGHLAERARAAQAEDDLDGAARWAVEYLQDDPFDEEMTAFLMECWRQCRKYAKAAQVYQRLKERLSEEMGADPLESTTMLYYKIMNQWNDSAQTGEEWEKLQPPVGREGAYAALRAAADSFAEGAARRCSQLLIGEVGSGKSALIDHFLRGSDRYGLLVVRCGCLQSEMELPLAPWDRIMLSLWTFAREEGLSLPVQVRARLGRTFSIFREEQEGTDQDSVRALRQWDQGLEDGALLVAAIIRRKKVLLILEDLQWMDGESVRLTEALLRRLEGGGLMTVLTCREDLPADTRARLSAMEADGLLHRQHLCPLSLEETTELLRRELGGEASGRLADQFYQETGGNLYLLTELTQAYRRSADVDATLQTLGELLMERLSGLPETAMSVAELISVFPEEAPGRLLLELLEGDDRALTDGVEALRGRGIIEEHRSERGMGYRFTHPRIRELVYHRLSGYRCQQLHRQAALLLSWEEAPREGAACRGIARHFRLAGDRLHAMEYQIRALDLDSARACEPFSIFGGEEPLCMDPDQGEEEAQRCLRELSALRREREDEAVLARLEQRLILIRGRLALFQGNTDKGTGLLGQLSAANGARDGTLMSRACYLLATSALYRQEKELAERYSTTGMRLLERGGDRLQQAQFQRLRGRCFYLAGAYDKAGYYLLEAVDTLERQPRSTAVKLQLAAAYCDCGRVSRQKQDYAGACAYFKKALELLGDGPWPGMVWIYVHYGRTVFMLEDHPKARMLFLQGWQAARATGELWGRTAAAAFTAYYQAQDGDYELAAISLAEAQDCQQRMDSLLEGAILCYVSMHIRRRLDLEKRKDSPLEKLLPYPADSYARQGIRILSGVPDVFEAEQLSQSLRDGIASQQRYRASELYSKNKHFMTE